VKLEQIVRRDFSQPDRAEVQERVAQQVEHDPEPFLARYIEDPRSFGGYYVNSDLFKETFAEYRESRQTRNRYNAPVHNAAAVLASEQFRRVISYDLELGPNVALFLTGIPALEKLPMSSEAASCRATSESCTKDSSQMPLMPSRRSGWPTMLGSELRLPLST
jgi:hypothetical protein